MTRTQTTWPSIFWALIVLSQGVVADVAEADDADEIVFHDDYNGALREARLTQKPIFLEFRCAP